MQHGRLALTLVVNTTLHSSSFSFRLLDENSRITVVAVVVIMPTHLCKCNDVADLLKTRPSP